MTKTTELPALVLPYALVHVNGNAPGMAMLPACEFPAEPGAPIPEWQHARMAFFRAMTFAFPAGTDLAVVNVTGNAHEHLHEMDDAQRRRLVTGIIGNGVVTNVMMAFLKPYMTGESLDTHYAMIDELILEVYRKCAEYEAGTGIFAEKEAKQ